MAQDRAPTIKEARAAAKAKREKREAAEAAAEKAAASKPEAPAESGLLDKIRAAFSSGDDINRIDKAVDAVTKGVDEANKGKKK